MSGPDPADVAALTRLGVARITFGGGLLRWTNDRLGELASALAAGV